MDDAKLKAVRAILSGTSMEDWPTLAERIVAAVELLPVCNCKSPGEKPKHHENHCPVWHDYWKQLCFVVELYDLTNDDAVSIVQGGWRARVSSYLGETESLGNPTIDIDSIVADVIAEYRKLTLDRERTAQNAVQRALLFLQTPGSPPPGGSGEALVYYARKAAEEREKKSVVAGQ